MQQHVAPVGRAGNRHLVVALILAAHVEHGHQALASVLALDGIEAALLLVVVEPRKARRVVVPLAECSVVEVEVAQRRHVVRERVVDGIVEHVPVLLTALVPLAHLPELAAHEVELLARMHVHVQVEDAGLGELVPVVAVHLVEDRGLAVHVLVVRQRQQVALVWEVHHRERELVVVVLALVRRLLKEVERIVHPPHVPLVVKAQAALLRALGGTGVVGGILGSQDAAGMHELEPAVHACDKGHVLVVDTACRVAHPVDDAADGIHAQAVEVELLHPEVGGGLHEAAALATRVHEVAAAPLRDTHVGVGVLKERGAVEVAQAPVVECEVHGNEVEDGADARLM